ncbi:MAG: toll/interleukin-1 receptor domain-containing protein [Gammaproteobacteria bacterium]|nr:toll/interleukin-1 receptor domain-containing protein [Gammaproteobacteria bacterium]
MGNYVIVLLHKEQDYWASQVKVAIKKAAGRFQSSSTNIEIRTDLMENDQQHPQVVAVLCSESCREDDVINALITDAMAKVIPVIPIVAEEEGDRISNVLPRNLRKIHAAKWIGNGASVTSSLLQSLGLINFERKIFISYRQRDTLELANQLHQGLSRRKFDVFLDRFSLDVGVDFQNQLEIDLSDKAFVLLLESDGVVESEGVRHEMTFSQTFDIPVVALTLPNCSKHMPNIQSRHRVQLKADEFTGEGTLSPKALSMVLDELELLHAQVFWDRRNEILSGVINNLESKEYECISMAEWSVLASGQEGNHALYSITPRRATTLDFFNTNLRINKIKDAAGIENLIGIVVHQSGCSSEEEKELLDWVSDLSEIRLTTLDTFAVH